MRSNVHIQSAIEIDKMIFILLIDFNVLHCFNPVTIVPKFSD